MKIFNKMTKEIRWEDDVSPLLEDIHEDILNVLADKHLDGHDEYDQWLMAVEHDLRHLLRTLSDREDYSLLKSPNEIVF